MKLRIPSQFKRICALFIALAAVSGAFIAIDATQAATTLTPGEVRVSKTVKAVADKVNTWDIELSIEARDSLKTSDTVLIIDRSNSMSGTGNGSCGFGVCTKLQNAKSAADKFVNTLLPTGNTSNRIAVVSFGGESVTNIGFTGAIGGVLLQSSRAMQVLVQTAEHILKMLFIELRESLQHRQPTTRILYCCRMENLLIAQKSTISVAT